MVGPVPTNVTRGVTVAPASETRPVAVVATTGSLATRIGGVIPGAVVVDPDVGDLVPALRGCSSVVDAGGSAAATRAVLSAAAAAGIRHAVIVSSAIVYGARPDNAVPLTEDAPVRPDPAFAPAVEAAERERLAADWRRDGGAAAVLRCAVVAGAAGFDAMAEELLGARGVTVRGHGRPAQVVHESDVASAVAVAVEQHLDGAFNVAPDGWIAPDTAEALAGGSGRVAVPARLARPVRAVGRIFGVGRQSPGIDAYLEHPWVVANDKLRALGWAPTHANEEALVVAQPPSWWRDLSPRRRQELALGVVGGTAVLGVVATVWGVIRSRRATGRR